MTYKLKIDGRLSGINEYQFECRKSHYNGNRMKKTSQMHVEWCILRDLKGVRAKPPVSLEYLFFEANKRRDHDNVSGFAHKVVQDALVTCKVIPDDGWDEIISYTDRFAVDRNHPRIEVTITEVDENGKPV